MRGLRRGASWLVILVAMSGYAAAAELRGVALVIGAADYEQLGDLTNTLNDARAMDEMLGDLGFDVTRVLDRDSARLRREIEDFVADAEGADVALVYYAGHAVEAAGQNFIVPIDADISTPQLAGQSLVPVSDLLDELARIVPVTIMLLDACRSEAFPDGAAIQLPGSDEAVPLAATGLGEMRGPAPLATADVAPENLGMVIGFAAAPGQPALDGEPGGNSPYASALLKHFSAGGYTFGDLMTLVTEEVYLKTGARQVPWMNSSLRRVLSFGAPIETQGDDQSLIRDGRRQLLLSIASQPAEVRAQVQHAAADAAVPMDTLYGLLEALGTDAPSDPAALDQLLKSQTDTLRQMMDERRALTSTDAEITRLAGLAQQALDEGAMQVSIGFWEQAKARYLEISAALDATEAQLEERRIEGGALLASVADSYVLSGDYGSAAENFGLAFAEVERWNSELALDYRGKQADALFREGEQQGDNAALQQSIEIYEAIGREVGAGHKAWGPTQTGLGGAYALLGTRAGDVALVARGVESFRAAVAAFDKETDRFDWAHAQTSLGVALSLAAASSTDDAPLHEAIIAYRAALEVLSPEGDASEWARTQLNLGQTFNVLGQRESGTESLVAAIDAFNAALTVETREKSPLNWAILQNNLGVTQIFLAERIGGAELLREAVTMLRGGLEVARREIAPMQWAQLQGNLGTALWQLGEEDVNRDLVAEAVVAYRAALEVVTPERDLPEWTIAMTNLATAQMVLGKAFERSADIEAAVATYRQVLDRIDRNEGELRWALAQHNLASTLNVLAAMRNGDAAAYDAAIVAAEAALEVRTRDVSALDWAMSQKALGDALAGRALSEPGTARLEAAVATYRAALEVRTAEGMPEVWAETQTMLGDALFELGLREDSGVETFSAALDAYSAASTVITEAGQPLDWATIANKAGWVLANVGYRLQSREAFQQGRDAIAAAWDKVKASGQTGHDAYFSERIAMIDEALKGLPAQ